MERRKMSVLRRGIGDEIKSLSVVVQIPFFLHLPTNLNSKGKLFILLSKIVWFRCLNHRLHLLIVSYRSGGLKPITILSGCVKAQDAVMALLQNDEELCLHMEWRALTLKWLNPIKRKGNSCHTVYVCTVSKQIRVTCYCQW